jgi:hypothetical protein
MEEDNKNRAQHAAMAAGLTRLKEAHLAELARSVESGRELSGILPKDLHWSEEIAVVFRAPLPRARR